VPLGDTGDLALEVLLALSIVVPLSVLIVVVHYFFKSARRFDVEQARASKAGEPSDADQEAPNRPHSEGRA
jgi:hypothetical protein